MDLPTFHPADIALGRHRARAVRSGIHAAGTPRRRQTQVTVMLNGSSMRVMEAGLAIVAIGTAVLLGVGR